MSCAVCRGRTTRKDDAISDPALFALLLAAGAWAGAQNALAGGGSFVTLPALIAAGLDAKTANITTTLALFPGQLTTGYAGRALVAGTERLSFRALAGLALGGGVVGAGILLLTPNSAFSAMLPWLVLVATALFGWSSFGPKPAVARAPPPRWMTVAAQFAIGVYCGFFGGGAGFMTLASLTIARMPVRNAAGTKNVLVALANLAAAPVLAASGAVAWREALALGLGSMAGGLLGAKLLPVLPEKLLKLLVVVIGMALFVGLMMRG